MKKKNGKKVHSTQKPESLLHRIILANTNKNDLIIDPFLGTGTTAVVAKKLGRNFFGIEKDKRYFEAAYKRINLTKKIEDNYLDTLENTKSKPRVPFGSLVELGILKPGTTLFEVAPSIISAMVLRSRPKPWPSTTGKPAASAPSPSPRTPSGRAPRAPSEKTSTRTKPNHKENGHH